jgi:serine/threonine protein kinase
MKPETGSAYTPLLGITMSERAILFKIYVLTDPQDPKIAVIDLCELRCPEGLTCLDPEAYQKLVRIVVAWVSLCDELICSPQLLQLIDTNLMLHEGRIYKVFDYRNKETSQENRRSPQHALQLLPECRMEVNVNDLVIISYAYIPGTHHPTRIGHLTKLFQQLCYLHEEVKIVHGDIRLSNLIFNDPEGEGDEEVKGEREEMEIENWEPCVTIIDFDFSGEAGVKRYPRGYNRDIEDGQRHKDAVELHTLQSEHDVFSCLHLCSLFLPNELFPQSPIPTAQEMFERLSLMDQQVPLSQPTLRKNTNATVRVL